MSRERGWGPQAVIRLEKLCKVFETDGAPVVAVDGVSLAIEEGTTVAVMGPSGCGKSTLLHLIGGLDRPTSGSVTVDGADLSLMPESKLNRYRRESVGIVFQFYNLLSTLSVVENIALPAILAGRGAVQATREAKLLADQMGLAGRAGHRVHQLSGGEMQRAAIARALINHPRIVLADEPTGNLDSKSAASILEVFRQLPKEHGMSVLLVTHSRESAEIASRIVHMKDGRVEEVEQLAASS